MARRQTSPPTSQPDPPAEWGHTTGPAQGSSYRISCWRWVAQLAWVAAGFCRIRRRDLQHEVRRTPLYGDGEAGTPAPSGGALASISPNSTGWAVRSFSGCPLPLPVRAAGRLARKLASVLECPGGRAQSAPFPGTPSCRPLARLTGLEMRAGEEVLPTAPPELPSCKPSTFRMTASSQSPPRPFHKGQVDDY